MPSTAVMVMPRRSAEWADAPAMWITAAGWAGAARKHFGASWVVTPDAIATPEQALGYTRPRSTPTSRRQRAPYVPTVVRTGIKDLLRVRSARAYRDVGEPSEWRDTEVELVWQHHDLFHRAGEPLASRRGCPLMSYVHAPQVWEAARWGVRRPGWAGLLERFGERPQLLASDVVACVSDEVAGEVARLGVPEDRLQICPMAVDADRFSPSVSGAAVRKRLGLENAFVVGWTGSFRRFHGLELAIEAFAELHGRVPGARLLLVGDGLERATLEAQAARLEVSDAVVFPGAAVHDEIPEYVAAMDVALVTARAGQDFHYSPLKMREYLATGTAVVAPRIGEIPTTVADGVTARLYEPGDARGLAAALEGLNDDAELRQRIGQAGREFAVRHCTWDVQLERLLASSAFDRAVGRSRGH